jgi:hypothetical protein
VLGAGLWSFQGCGQPSSDLFDDRLCLIGSIVDVFSFVQLAFIARYCRAIGDFG